MGASGPAPRVLQRSIPGKNCAPASLIDVRIISDDYDIRVLDHCEVERTSFLFAALPRWERAVNNFPTSRGLWDSSLRRRELLA